MKFDLISDLHIAAFYQYDMTKFQPSSDILAILGDVCEIKNLHQLIPFFKYVSENWKTILYVPGNHEFYGDYLDNGVDMLESFLIPYKNITVLNNVFILINDINFIGSTLWSDMNNEDPLTIFRCKDVVNDYHYIKKSFVEKRIINPYDTIDLFKKNVSFIKQMLKLVDSNPVVVLTHHAPSSKSVSPKFVGNPINGAFASNCENIILDNPNIKVWAHGHTHSKTNYMIGDCQVVANPLGYKMEIFKNANDYKPVTIEVLK